MVQSLKCATTLVVAAWLVLGSFPRCPDGRLALGTPPPTVPHVVTPPPSPDGGRGAPPRGPNAGEIIGGMLRLGAEAARQQAEREETGRWEPRPKPWVPTPTEPPNRVWPPPGRVWPPPDNVWPPPPGYHTPELAPNQVYSPAVKNLAPAQPPPNPIEMPVEVEQNAGFSLSGQGVTPRMLAGWKIQTRQQSEKAVADIRSLIPQDATEALEKLNEIEERAYQGTLTAEDLQALAGSMKSSLPRGMARAANHLFHRLAVLSRLITLLDTAVPGGGPIPFGNQVPIVLVPGLPRGTIFVLGNGAVVIGVGNLRRYVAVGRGNVAQAAGMCVGIGSPLADAAPKPTQGALLINAEKLEVHYNVNNHAYTMQSGYKQTLPAGRRWVVAFDRGGSFGEAKYALSEGTYKFTVTEKGWDLFRHTFDVTIDNGENPFEFFYVVNNRHQGLPPGEAQKHSHIYPLLVRFDNGRGETKAKTVESGIYRVAVDQENALDLFPEDAVATPSIREPEPYAIASSSVPTPPSATSPSTPTPTPSEAPPSAVAATSPEADAAATNPFGDQGDWRPSLFVSDVPEIAYFEEPGLGAGPLEDSSGPLSFGRT